MNAITTNRRLFLRNAGLALPAAWLSLHGTSVLAQASAQAAETAVPPIVVQARAAAAAGKITVKPLRNKVSLLMGTGGNIAVLTGKEGKLLVDSGYSTAKPQTLEALATLSSDPIRHLINTHWHFDHTDGNEWMHEAGAVILAHTRTRDHLSVATTMQAFQTTFPAAPRAALPTKVFETEHTLKHDQQTLHLSHYAPAHTDSDIFVHFTEANILHAGDTWFNGFYPFIDYSTGGSINGMITAAEKTLAMVNADTMIIPGHGPLGAKPELQDFHDMLAGVRDAVAAQKKQGKSLAETVAAKPTAAFDEKWGKGFLPADTFVALVYAGV